MTKKAKRLAIAQFQKDINRAKELFSLLVTKGGKLKANGQFTHYLQPDKRDIAQ